MLFHKTVVAMCMLLSVAISLHVHVEAIKVTEIIKLKELLLYSCNHRVYGSDPPPDCLLRFMSNHKPLLNARM